MPYFDFAVIGGDKRSTYMIPILRSKGYRVISFQTSEETPEEEEANSHAKRAKNLEEAVLSAEAVILGIPICRNGFLNVKGNVTMLQLANAVKTGQMIFGGAIGVQDRDVLYQKTRNVYDYFHEEKISVFNAMATAEGVILEILKNSDRILSHQRILLFGFGRCGKNIAFRLRGMQADVVVATDREEERSWAYACGMKPLTLSEAKDYLHRVEIIVNTIPFPFIGRRDLQKLKKNTCLFEVASRSCLVDEETSKDTMLQIIYLPGLPGKYSARSLAEVYTEFVCEKWRGEKEPWN